MMPKPVGALCNLRCSYCYYLDKKELYPNNPKPMMSEEVLEEFTKQYLESQTMLEVQFTWHGGEALMRGIDFYKKALVYQQKYARGRKVFNCLQTNGTLLNDDWCRFFKDNNFLVGISIDGTQQQHDTYRKTADGRSSFKQVMRGIELLKKHGVEFNAMAVVSSCNVEQPLDFYRSFKNADCRFIQFSPIVEYLKDCTLAPWSIDAEKWGDFLIAIFDEWVRNDIGQVFVQYFDAALACWMGEQPGVCMLAKTCGHAGVVEFNGDVYACDHMVFPQYKLGNIRDRTLTEMMYSAEQLSFGNSKFSMLPTQCRECRFLFTCHGECPKNRTIKTSGGESGLNYLCRGYYKFFSHIAPYMEMMKHELLNERSPANVMKIIHTTR